MLTQILDIVLGLRVSDVLLLLAALLAGGYCMVLARNLRRFNNLEDGMGGAIAVLSAQVDDLTRMLARAEASAKASAEELSELTARSEEGAKRLEMLLASLHDLPERDRAPEEPTARFFRAETLIDYPEAAE